MSKKLFFALPILAILMIIGCAFPVVFAARESGLEVEYTAPVTECNVGERVALPKVTAVYPDRVASVTLSVKKPSGAEATVKANEFVADEAGAFTVYIVVAGVNGATDTVFYTVTATVADYPVMTSTPYIPDVYLSGKTYAVPKAEFTDYSSGEPLSADYRAECTGESGSVTVLGETFVPAVSVGGNKIKLTYIAGKGDKQNSVSYDIPVMIAGETDAYGYPVYDYASLFYSHGGGIATVTDNGVELSATSDAKFSFANRVNASFKFELLPVKGFNSFGGVRVVVTDALDKNVSISLTVKKGDTDRTSTMVLNDGQGYSANGSLTDYNSGVKFEFNNVNCFIKDNLSANVCRVTECLNGEEFTGFPSKTVYMTFEIIETNVASKVNVAQINSHYFSTDGYDAIPPIVVLEKYVKNSVNVGETVVVPAGYAADVVDPNAKAYVSVTKGGAAVKDVSGTEIRKLSADKAYEFSAAETGEYVILYTAVDESENVYDVGYYTVYVTDDESPVLTLNTTLNSSYSWGSKITIPEFTATDNGGTVNTIVYITGPSAGYKVVKAGDSYTFTAYGKHYIRYMAYDAFGNVTVLTLTVEVV